MHGKTVITFRHLLAHCSGLAAWRPFYQRIAEIEKSGRVNFMASYGAKEFAYEEIHREKPEAPPATKTIYSDLGFILLGETIEKVASVALNRFCREKIFRPLGLRATDYIDISQVALAAAGAGRRHVRADRKLSFAQAAAGRRG